MVSAVIRAQGVDQDEEDVRAGVTPRRRALAAAGREEGDGEKQECQSSFPKNLHHWSR
jgi:hypothetical protein